MTFRVGQKVVCVDSAPLPGYSWSGDGPNKGEIYSVTKSYIDDDEDEVLHLAELRRSESAIDEWGPMAGYGASRFRPIVERKTSIEIFTSMLKPSKVEA